MNKIFIIIFVVGFIGFVAIVIKTKKLYLLREAAIRAILEAERMIGDGQGDKKFALATQKVKDFLPWYLDFWITEDTIKNTINAMFDILKSQLSKGSYKVDIPEEKYHGIVPDGVSDSEYKWISAYVEANDILDKPELRAGIKFDIRF